MSSSQPETKKKAKKSGMKNLTVGKPSKVLLLYALPLLGSFLVQQLYSAVDLIFVGQFIGKEASSAVGSSDLLITCIVGLFTGISVGSGVVAAQAFGAGDRKTLKKLIQTVYTFSLIGATVLFIVGQLMAPTFLHWLSTPDDVYPLALNYLRIYFVSVLAIILYNLGSGIVRALGDSGAALR
ncbi:MAG: MATE family efflux transporter, partial [Lachnospiraceae bacterium]|nr:MATE family efflux transporter [Lachnospiraceae bacterium]